MSSTSRTSSPCAQPVTLRSFKVRLKALTPIHIGSGEKLNKLDYYLDGGSFCRVDMDGLFRDPAFAGVRDVFLQSAPNGQPIDSLLGSSGLHRQHVLYRIPIHASASNCHETEVSTFVKSAGRVYIPGSSLKGAILSALCWRELKQKDKQAAERVLLGYYITVGDGRRKHVYDDPLDITLKAFGGRAADQPYRFAHWLDVSDSDLLTPEVCLELMLAESKKWQPQTPNPGAQRSSGPIPILLEAVKPATEFSCTLKCDPAFRLSGKELLQTVNDFYQEVAENDSLVLPDRGLQLPQAGLVRVGSASGFFATSLLLTARKHGLGKRYLDSLSRSGRRVTAPRSRKRIGSLALGWAQLEMVS